MPPTNNAEQLELVNALATAQISLAFAWRKTPGEWKCVRVPLLQEAADQFRELATGAATDLHSNRVETPYNPEWPLKNTEFFAIANPRAAIAVGGDLFPQLDDFGQLESFSRTRRRSNPNLYVILAQLADDSIAMFGRRVTARHLLDSKKWMRLFWTDDVLTVLDDGPVLAFDRHLDWIEWRETMLVVDAPNFHASFRDVAQLRAAVQGHVATITAHIAIANSNAFVARCQSVPSMASKLDKVIEQRHFERPVAELQAYSANYPGLSVEWRDDELVFDESIEKQFAILKLLDEAGYTGDLSGDKFEAAAKRPL